MKKSLLATAFGVALLGNFGAANAQVAGSTTATEAPKVASGWSVKKTVLGKTVYNEKGDKVGKVEDLIIDPEKSVSYLIIGAGGFVGMGRHDVAVPIASTQEKDGKLVMAGATKDSVKSMAPFVYAKDTSSRDRFVAKAEQDLAKAKVDVADLQKKAGEAKSEAKVRLDRDIAAVQADVKKAEDKLGEMKQADATRWKEFEASVSAAMARMHKSLSAALA